MNVQNALTTLTRDGAWVLTCTRCNKAHDAADGGSKVVPLFVTIDAALAQAGGPHQPLDDLEVAHIGPGELADAVALYASQGYGIGIVAEDGAVAVGHDAAGQVFPGGIAAAPPLRLRESVLTIPR